MNLKKEKIARISGEGRTSLFKVNNEGEPSETEIFRPRELSFESIASKNSSGFSERIQLKDLDEISVEIFAENMMKVTGIDEDTVLSDFKSIVSTGMKSLILNNSKDIDQDKASIDKEKLFNSIYISPTHFDHAHTGFRQSIDISSRININEFTRYSVFDKDFDEYMIKAAPLMQGNSIMASSLFYFGAAEIVEHFGTVNEAVDSFNQLRKTIKKAIDNELDKDFKEPGKKAGIIDIHYNGEEFSYKYSDSPVVSAKESKYEIEQKKFFDQWSDLNP